MTLYVIYSVSAQVVIRTSVLSILAGIYRAAAASAGASREDNKPVGGRGTRRMAPARLHAPGIRERLL